MPQMAPISWFLLFIIFSGTLLLFNFLTYYSFLPSNPSTTQYQTINPSPLNWKW
uniref:ATP synthase complex subunit 8 n=1 Tax=Neoperla gibbosa TaxID=3049219 RepID=A0AA96C5B9_9NEOP|nr:ATPase subunit 8 [Neoperla gibbosa]WNH42023.1 ATPase subunit 8 [Neoperla gibbosa]